MTSCSSSIKNEEADAGAVVSPLTHTTFGPATFNPQCKEKFSPRFRMELVEYEARANYKICFKQTALLRWLPSLGWIWEARSAKVEKGGKGHSKRQWLIFALFPRGESIIEKGVPGVAGWLSVSYCWSQDTENAEKLCLVWLGTCLFSPLRSVRRSVRNGKRGTRENSG